METKQFLVKENSLQEFASAYFLEDEINGHRRDTRDRINPYNILGGDRIFARKSILEQIGVSGHVVFEIIDESNKTRSKMTHTYKYLVEMYDDFTVMLILFHFKVKTKFDEGK